MPCQNYERELSSLELESKRVCQLLTYALPAVGKDVPAWVVEVSKHPYGSPKRADEATAMLCEICGSLDEDQTAKVIYDGRNPEARKLADWWDSHQKDDAARKQREEEKKAKDDIKSRALEKLTPEERNALGL